jgi:hypothetical protein
MRADMPGPTRKDEAVCQHSRSAARHAEGAEAAGISTVGPVVVGAPVAATERREHPMGMFRNVIASGVAAKVVQELRKPQNQAKIKQFVRDFQAKQKGGGTRPTGRGY